MDQKPLQGSNEREHRRSSHANRSGDDDGRGDPLTPPTPPDDPTATITSPPRDPGDPDL
jgi:hypothetical protein